MTEVEAKKLPPEDVFGSQNESESQTLVGQPRRQFFQRLFRTLLLAFGVASCYLLLPHLRSSASPQVISLGQSDDHPRRLAEDIFL